MSKGLEALENIKRDMEYVTRLDFVKPIVRGEVQQELYKIYHRETPELDTIEKELKALDVIKYKQVNVYSFIQRKPKTFEEYQDIDDEIEQLSEVSLSMEEYDLLKEVLK